MGVALMRLQIRRLAEALAADVAAERPHSRVGVGVSLEFRRRDERLAANLALVAHLVELLLGQRGV